MARPLLIDESTRQQITKTVHYAEQHPYTIPRLLGVAQGQAPAAGNNPEHQVMIPVGFRCVFTIDHNVKKRYRHLSVSVDTPGKLPSVAHVQAIMKEFGFQHRIGYPDLHIHADEPGAINIMEEIV